MRKRSTLWVELVAILLFVICTYSGYSQDKFVKLSGYITTEGLTQNTPKPTGQATITIVDANDTPLSFAYNASGAFYAKLPIGQEFTLQAVLDGYLTKTVVFNLSGIDPEEFNTAKSNFGFDVTLVESKYLLPSWKSKFDKIEVFWNNKTKELDFTSEVIESQWQALDSIKYQYAMALDDNISESKASDLMYLKDGLVWPNIKPSDSLNMTVFKDYPLYVQLQKKAQETEDSKTIVVEYLENLKQLKTIQPSKIDMLYLGEPTMVNSDSILADLPESTLLLTNQGRFNNSMVNFVTNEGEVSFELNEIELAKRGFQVSDQVRLMATITANKEEWKKAMLSAQHIINDEKHQIQVLEQQSSNLADSNAQLMALSDSLGIMVEQKNHEVEALQASILTAERRLEELSLKMEERQAYILATESRLAERQLAIENLEKSLEKKQADLSLAGIELVDTQGKIYAAQEELADKITALNDAKRTNLWIALALAFISLSLVLAIYGFFKQRSLIALVRKQSHQVNTQRKMLEAKNLEMQDSINYAKRIQQKMLPAKNKLNTYFKDSFIMFQPKDVVSGDFFWIKESGGKAYFAVADCTGHGVPGALMSVVCTNALDRALRQLGPVDPGKILDLTRTYVLEQISQGDESMMDGMDIALCSYEESTHELQFAGAQNPVWIFSDRTIEADFFRKLELQGTNKYLYEIKGDKQPVGYFINQASFESYSIRLQEGDSIYIFSDGFADQFGGNRGKKMKYSLFKELIGIAQDQSSFKSQHEFISEYFVNWRGDLEQVDDVCVMGVKV